MGARRQCGMNSSACHLRPYMIWLLLSASTRMLWWTILSARQPSWPTNFASLKASWTPNANGTNCSIKERKPPSYWSRGASRRGTDQKHCRLGMLSNKHGKKNYQPATHPPLLIYKSIKQSSPKMRGKVPARKSREKCAKWKRIHLIQLVKPMGAAWTLELWSD